MVLKLMVTAESAASRITSATSAIMWASTSAWRARSLAAIPATSSVEATSTVTTTEEAIRRND